MNKAVRWGLVSATTFLIIAGVYQLSQDEYDNAYVCSKSNKIGIFEYLSKTNVTGYWHNETGSIKQSTCTKGKWESCKTSKNIACKKINVIATEDKATGLLWCTDICEEIVN